MLELRARSLFSCSLSYPLSDLCTGCPPCKKFTPQLASAYSRLRAKGKRFEVVLAGCDQQEAAFDAYRAAMPWPSLPFGSTVVTRLAEAFRVDGIPKLVLISSDGELVSEDGVRLLRKHALAFPWSSSKPVETPRTPQPASKPSHAQLNGSRRLHPMRYRASDVRFAPLLVRRHAHAHRAPLAPR